VAAFAVVMVAMAPTFPRAQSSSLKAVMQDKAQNTQALLNPLVLGDFRGMERYVAQLSRLTYTEVASWQAQPNSQYQQQASAFLAAIEDLGQATEARDAKHAATAYANLVSSCVNCHQLVKARQSVTLTPPAPVLDSNVLAGS
jgi:hypothetical protein